MPIWLLAMLATVVVFCISGLQRHGPLLSCLNAPPQVQLLPRMCPVTTAEIKRTLPTIARAHPRHVTDVVVFIPTPVPWEARRHAVHTRFAQEGWADEQVVLLFVLGERDADTSSVSTYARATYVRTPCNDQGDAPDNAADISATTCKVYEALKHVVANYEAKYVWRGAHDSYLNLPYFFQVVAPSLPKTRLYYGRLRRSTHRQEDLQVAHHPQLQALFGIMQWGQYMSGMGYLLSYDVADFVASLKIPPHLTW